MVHATPYTVTIVTDQFDGPTYSDCVRVVASDADNAIEQALAALPELESALADPGTVGTAYVIHDGLAPGVTVPAFDTGPRRVYTVLMSRQDGSIMAHRTPARSAAQAVRIARAWYDGGSFNMPLSGPVYVGVKFLGTLQPFSE